MGRKKKREREYQERERGYKARKQMGFRRRGGENSGVKGEAKGQT